MLARAHLNTMSIFEAPRIYAIREDGCLTLKLGDITLNVYGDDPFKVAPEIIVVTQEEYTKLRTADILAVAMAESGVTDETPPVG